jgi:hypothetical protein
LCYVKHSMLMIMIKSRQKDTTHKKTFIGTKRLKHQGAVEEDVSQLTWKVTQAASLYCQKGLWRGCLHQ